MYMKKNDTPEITVDYLIDRYSGEVIVALGRGEPLRNVIGRAIMHATSFGYENHKKKVMDSLEEFKKAF